MLVDRAKESRLVEAQLDKARGGQSQVLIVRGEPGIGKTALLEHAIASASGFQVARAAGVESEMELPFAGLHQLCAPMLDRLALLPGPQRDAMSTAFGMADGPPPGPVPDRAGCAQPALLGGRAGPAAVRGRRRPLA